jgi:arylsulfatase
MKKNYYRAFTRRCYQTTFGILLFFSSQTKVSAQYSPTPAFDGKIGKTVADTRESLPKTQPQAPDGAPNVVWIHIDDIGYGASSAFGGLIETPNFERLANQGLRYTNYHTCAFSAPTRAALLTGRNQHSVHFGSFAHNSYNTPGYDGYLPFEKATIAEILRENGYNTFAIGKYHLTHPSDATQAGPFNRWPTGRGFDHYFGFPPESGLDDQWNPVLYRDTQREPEDPQGRHVTELLANEAIKYISGQKSAAPDKPFFLYFSTGAGHSPHQVSKEWINKYKGKFDQGWDKYREDVLKNQIKLGVVPAGTKLAPQNPGVKAWNSLSPNEKKLFTRHMELYAGFISQTDYEIGRIISFIEQIGQLDNTLVVVLIGDNGAEAPGDLGQFLPNAPSETREQILDKYIKNLDLLGTEKSFANYPDGWAAATNTPFRYYKGFPTFEGGTRNPLILFYPKKIKDKGGIRHQYTYVNDILPTTVELVGAKTPAVINGYPQEPVEGVSLAYTIAPENKNLPERHTVQYHEMLGAYAIYKDGWKASFPSKSGGLYRKAAPESDKKIQLYNMREDFNELNNLADKYPEKVKELADVFDAEARKYNVYPLKETWEITNRNIYDGKNKVVLYPGAYLVSSSIPYFVNTNSYSILADVDIQNAKDQGVLLSLGGYLGGISLYVKNNKLYFAYNAEGKTIELTSNKTISSGKQKLKAEIRQEANSRNKSVILYINGEKVAEQKFESGLARHSVGGYSESLDIGTDVGTPVSSAYESPFSFTGKINHVTLEVIQ